MKPKSYIIDDQDLMSEWDWDNNVGLDPKILTRGSNKKAWWICKKCGHKWCADIHHRAVRKQGCLNCRYLYKKQLSSILSDTHPKVLKYWDFSKNKLITPEIVSQNSRKSVWWHCPDCGHEWEEKIKNQVKKLVWCPHCKKGIKDLASVEPELAKEWHKTKNTDSPEHISYASSKYAWWKCRKCGYEWKARIANRSILNRGCPCCSGGAVVVGINDLKTKFPHIAKEWHPTKNGELLPEQVTSGTRKKVWWQCPLGHEYQATVGHRTAQNGTGCPICYSGRQTSFAEQAVFFYVKQLYPDAISRYKAKFLGKFELDVYIPSIKYAIEYDGEAWHRANKLEREKRKYQLCKQNGIILLRLREKEPEHDVKVADDMICVKNLYEHKNLEMVLRQLLMKLNPQSMMSDNFVNLARDNHKILGYKKSAVAESLVVTRPDIAMEWHPTKNGNLLPSMFKAGSDHKVWWICPKCGNEYQSSISHRTSKKVPTGCPKCGKERSDLAKSVAVNMLDLKTQKVLQTFVSVSDASRQMKINLSNICMACKGQRNQAGGYGWEYAWHHEKHVNTIFSKNRQRHCHQSTLGRYQ